ncbi:MAG: DMT family transporter [Proteobacteria bacterium]|uniref:DMT family transporter n=1 Tax=Candidatus Avisuccinivibrio stercorigallinarum TaxID=2840704 RepID=A0A9D9DAR0_9GAMM|nr:DMT family transporter [Candidatus Avisuccinivibrio stercorigallinarum]
MGAALLLLHLSIVIAGFTGILGRLITLDAYALTLYRCILASLFLVLLLKLRGLSVRPCKSDLIYFAIGAVLAVHWMGFYGAIKLSNVSIGVVCLSAMAFSSAILEPFILKRRFKLSEFVFAGIGISGILLIFGFDAHFRAGIICGLVCAVLASLYTILNKKYAAKAPSRQRVVLFEIAGGACTLLFMLPGYLAFEGAGGLALSLPDLIWLLLLASVCTVGLNVLQVMVLKQVSAFTVNLSYNLEPVYSIVLAMIIFAENRELSAAFYAGLALIAASVLLQTLSVIRKN